MEGFFQAKPKYNCWCHGRWSWQAWWLPWCSFKLQLHRANSCRKCWFSCGTSGIVRRQEHINWQKYHFLCCSPYVSHTTATSSTVETISAPCHWLFLSSKYPWWFEWRVTFNLYQLEDQGNFAEKSLEKWKCSGAWPNEYIASCLEPMIDPRLRIDRVGTWECVSLNFCDTHSIYVSKSNQILYSLNINWTACNCLTVSSNAFTVFLNICLPCYLFSFSLLFFSH